MFKRLFGGEPVAGTPDDLFWLLRRKADLPRLYLCCGTEDALHPESVRFAEECRARDIALTMDFGPGAHDWAYWDARIRDVLAWFQVVRR
jgi:S-formylglutathione hydrolase FrmB